MGKLGEMGNLGFEVVKVREFEGWDFLMELFDKGGFVLLCEDVGGLNNLFELGVVVFEWGLKVMNIFRNVGDLFFGFLGI